MKINRICTGYKDITQNGHTYCGVPCFDYVIKGTDTAFRPNPENGNRLEAEHDGCMWWYDEKEGRAKILHDPTKPLSDEELRYITPCIKDPKPMQISIPDARRTLLEIINNAIGESFEWLPEYDEIAAWLGDNERKGLFLCGSCGVGKSFITTKVIPAILRVYRIAIPGIARARSLTEPLLHYVTIIDDVGEEPPVNNYGVKSYPFADTVERLCDIDGALLIASSNLTPSELRSKYGDRVADRLRSMCRVISIEHQSFRK